MVLNNIKSPDFRRRSQNIRVSMNIAKTGRIYATNLTTDQILLWPEKERKCLKAELVHICSRAFPKDSEENPYIPLFFESAENKFLRQALFLRNEQSQMIGATLFAQGDVVFSEKTMKGIYIIIRVVLPEYQGCGLGQIMSLKVLTESSPDVLFTTCAQSNSLHSWLGLPGKRLITGFEVFPRIEKKGGKESTIIIPCEYLDFVKSTFGQAYSAAVDAEPKDIEKAMQNLTRQMVRQNIYSELYDFEPWKKSGREDGLAKALGVTDRDGILVIFIKLGLLR